MKVNKHPDVDFCLWEWTLSEALLTDVEGLKISPRASLLYRRV